ncbi:unnamed protein product [Tuber aestivum]|uniref:Uncharacterized protein n=1 Tax=Tuber aestivum TaxID=59557 RepID=A0A292PIR4_9PEZI|nr:unnamed protein product [Tuber aestivum]
MLVLKHSKIYLNSDATDQESEEEDYIESLRSEWEARYSNLTEQHKWILASGRRVENIIYEASKELDMEMFAFTPAAGFILDISDPQVEGWFSKDEWQEIMSRFSPLPQINPRLSEALNKFLPVKTTTMLHNILGPGLIPDSISSNQTISATLQWVEMYNEENLKSKLTHPDQTFGRILMELSVPWKTPYLTMV